MNAIFAIVGAIVGALAAILAALITTRSARRDAQAEQRRAAYSAFIHSQDELYRRMATPETIDSQVRKTTVGEAIGSGIGSVSSAYTAVRLTGSEDVIAKARVCQDITWEIFNLFFADSKEASLSAGDFVGQLDKLLTSYQKAANQFLAVARKDLGNSGGVPVTMDPSAPLSRPVSERGLGQLREANGCALLPEFLRTAFLRSRLPA